MLSKLRAETDVYEATCVIVARDDRDLGGLTVRQDVVPEDLGVARFMETLVRETLDRTPIEMHVGVRERREHRVIPWRSPLLARSLPKAGGRDASE